MTNAARAGERGDEERDADSGLGRGERISSVGSLAASLRSASSIGIVSPTFATSASGSLTSTFSTGALDFGGGATTLGRLGLGAGGSGKGGGSALDSRAPSKLMSKSSEAAASSGPGVVERSAAPGVVAGSAPPGFVSWWSSACSLMDPVREIELRRPARTRCKNSSADAGRTSGRALSARDKSPSSQPGTSGRAARTDGAARFSPALRRASNFSDACGGAPVSIVYATAAAA